MTKDINLDCGHPYGQDGEEAPVASLPLAPVEPTSAGPAWTAGPWFAYWEATAPYPGIDGEEGSVVLFGYEGEDCGIRGKDQEQRDANARLISAAPDLYEALERSAEGWANAIELGIIPHQHVGSATILRDEARAALAKARGHD